ncbi:MAG: phenylalanine--tRNA ligase subunit beta [Bacteroidetes bacterium]|nr:phenylalanine--tRNA ligase subunit beta [bacterium]NBP63789.1 phenylalanine--tRNA ligase subunit beta [Bacteroidota bacterium]
MIASVKWLKECYPFKKDIANVAQGLTMLGIEVEAIQDESAKFKGFVTGKVVRKESHPNADSLSVCTVDTGNEESIIICGAPNVDAGQTVIVAQFGAIIPNGGFSIGKRKLRGIESNGMICSKHELQLGEDDGGIWVLPNDTPIGLPLADALGMDDIYLEIGITPNRADCLSHMGLAREIACFEDNIKDFMIPGLAESEAVYATHRAEGNPKVTIQDSDLCHRYAGLKVDGINNGESPDWLKRRLESIGLRPKNIVVDVSNYVMFETGQPLHTFDANLIAGNSIIVKRSSDNQLYETLDGKTRTLNGNVLLICDAEKPIAIAGVMGGKNSEITEQTTSVFIESAYFQPSSIRKTAKMLGISSDAAYRFERGVDINIIPHAAKRAAQLIIQLAGGYIVDELIDEYPQKHKEIIISLDLKKASSLLGIEIQQSVAVKHLELIGCTITNNTPSSLEIIAPSWRIDIHEEIDLIEELARIIGYDNLPINVDVRFPGNASIDPKLKQHSLRNIIRKQLTSMGLQEIVTNSLMNAEKAMQFTDDPIRLINPLGEEYAAMRPSLIPASLEVIARNWNAGQRNIALFDIGRVFKKDASIKESIVSLDGYNEREHLLVVLAGSAHHHHWKYKNRDYDFYDAKGLAEAILTSAKIDVLSTSSAIPHEFASTSVMSQNALSFLGHDNAVIASVGQLLPTYCSDFDCTMPVFAIIIDLTTLYTIKNSQSAYKPISMFPAVQRDLVFIVDANIPAQDIIETARKEAGILLTDITVFDVFKGASIGEGKVSIGLRLTFQSEEKTLVDEEVSSKMSKIIRSVTTKHNAKLRDM